MGSTYSFSDYPFPESELTRLRDREWILNLVPSNTIGAELGVFRGHFSELILDRVRPKKLYLNDFWRLQGTHYDDYGDYTNFGRLPTALAMEEVKFRADKYADSCEIVIVEKPCISFLSELDEKLDFVYLDTYHTFQETFDQLHAIDRVLAKKGLILGDDWWPDRNSPHHGVFLAVHEFLRNAEFEMITCGRGGQWCLRRSESK